MAFIDTINYKVYKDNIHIDNSYTIRNVSTMKYILRYIMENIPSDYPVKQMKMTPMILEWSAHNLLYRLNYQPERTKSVDLNIGESRMHKIGYFLLGIIGIIFP